MDDYFNKNALEKTKQSLLYFICINNSNNDFNLKIKNIKNKLIIFHYLIHYWQNNIFSPS